MDVAENAAQHDRELLIGDLANRLARWAAVERDERMGNPSFSVGLTLLVGCLKRHKARPVTDLADLRLEYGDGSPGREPRKPPLELPDQLDSLEWDQVIAILDNEGYQKKQLVELGERRLGIPRSKLSRLRRDDAIASIRAALDNERSLSVIGQQARLAGQRRSM